MYKIYLFLLQTYQLFSLRFVGLDLILLFLRAVVDGLHYHQAASAMWNPVTH